MLNRWNCYWTLLSSGRYDFHQLQAAVTETPKDTSVIFINGEYSTALSSLELLYLFVLLIRKFNHNTVVLDSVLSA